MKAILRCLLCMALSSPGLSLADDITISDPWVREGPPGIQVLAGYMEVRNGSGTDVVLVGATSADFASIEMHRTDIADGMARMTAQSAIRIPAGGSVSFRPNGYHLMLMMPARPMGRGAQARISLQFEHHAAVSAVFPVRAGTE